MNIDFSFLHLHGTLLDLKWMSLPVTVFWLVGIANAVNLIDGMDGLAAGVSAISALTIWSVSLAGSLDRPYSALLAAVLAGALLGFLRWNFNPARIFLGDSGAYLVGFVLGAISIMGVIKGATANTIIVPCVLLILFFPILDTSWAILRRVARGRSPFEPDAGHIHHRLLQTGLSQKKVAYLIYFVSATLGLVAASLVHQQKYFLMLAGTVLVMAVFFAEVLNRHRQRRGVLGSGNIEDDDPDEKKNSPPPRKAKLAPLAPGADDSSSSVATASSPTSSQGANQASTSPSTSSPNRDRSAKPRLTTGKDKKGSRVRSDAKKGSRVPVDEKIKKPTSEEGSESLRP
jgi:hypothetical protein